MDVFKLRRVADLSLNAELALMNSAPRAATVRAAPGTGRLRVATLGEKAFTRLLGRESGIVSRTDHVLNMD